MAGARDREQAERSLLQVLEPQLQQAWPGPPDPLHAGLSVGVERTAQLLMIGDLCMHGHTAGPSGCMLRDPGNRAACMQGAERGRARTLGVLRSASKRGCGVLCEESAKAKAVANPHAAAYAQIKTLHAAGAHPAAQLQAAHSIAATALCNTMFDPGEA